MLLYLVKRTDNCNYGEYESFIVSCDNEEEAKHTLPNAENIGLWDGTINPMWTSIEFVEVKLIGVGFLNKKYVVHKSFIGG